MRTLISFASLAAAVLYSTESEGASGTSAPAPASNLRDITIGGVTLKAPAPYKVGHVLTEGEAAALNQTYLENIGNGFRSTIDAAVRAALAEKGPDGKSTEAQLKAVPDQAIKDFDRSTLVAADFQPMLDKRVAEYVMGARRSSSVEAIDPVEKEFRNLAWEKIKVALTKKSIKINSINAEKKMDLIEQYRVIDVKNGNKLLTAAKRRVKLAEDAAKDSLEDLDLDLSDKPSDAGVPENGANGNGGEVGEQPAA